MQRDNKHTKNTEFDEKLALNYAFFLNISLLQKRSSNLFCTILQVCVCVVIVFRIA